MNNYNPNYNDDLNPDGFNLNPDGFGQNHDDNPNGYTDNNSINNSNSIGNDNLRNAYGRSETPSDRHANVQDPYLQGLLNSVDKPAAQNAGDQGAYYQDSYRKHDNAVIQNSNFQDDNQQNPGDLTEMSNQEQNSQNGNSDPEESFNFGGSYNMDRRSKKRFQKYLETPSDQTIIFSSRAYNAIVSETFAKDPVETGGILLGYILDNGFWIVTEAIPPGKESINQYAYFEYDTEFVNYVANRVAIQYKIPPQVLGLWHRHPGHMDTFSGTDDGTNYLFASANNQYGAISGLVNIDPRFRFTIYHVTCHGNNQVQYQRIGFEVGDDFIPEEYFQLKHFGTSKPVEAHGADDLVIPEAGATGQTPEQSCNNSDSSRLKIANAILEALLILLLSVNIFLFLKPAPKTGAERLPQTSEAVIQPAGIQQEAAFQEPVVPSKVQASDPEFSEPVVGKSESKEPEIADDEDSFPAGKNSDYPEEPADNTVTSDKDPNDNRIDNPETKSALENQLDQGSTTDFPTDEPSTNGAQESPAPSMYRSGTITDAFDNQTAAPAQTASPEVGNDSVDASDMQ
ncbi:MAG: Mov34/MPN/PAD-1 family protein [Thermoguttaceae bacterium]|nr:Mov34/MPN/PAD-1 family protein [Thermoguttaceae bacterium]